jgi:hypothetical protein
LLRRPVAAVQDGDHLGRTPPLRPVAREKEGHAVTSEEFEEIRRLGGWSRAWLAARWGASEGAVEHWGGLGGARSIPEHIARDMQRLKRAIRSVPPPTPEQWNRRHPAQQAGAAAAA